MSLKLCCVCLESFPILNMRNHLLQKEVEEEKQARVSQVSDLLGWVKGLQGRTGGPSAESSLAAQQVQQHTPLDD